MPLRACCGADEPALAAAYKKANVDYDIQNAEGDADKMQTIADGMITDGATVLAIVNLDSDSGAAIEEKAKCLGDEKSNKTATACASWASVLRP